MKLYDDNSHYREKRRLRFRLIVLLCALTIPLLTYLETKVSPLDLVNFPVSGNVLVFALINLNTMLFLLMVFLVLRNLAELIIERKSNLLGSRLRTKFVIFFISLSLIPTGLLFFISLQFVSTSMDYWFNINVEKSLDESLQIARTLYQDSKLRLRQSVFIASEQLTIALANKPIEVKQLEFILEKKCREHNFAGMQLFGAARISYAQFFSSGVDDLDLSPVPRELIQRTFNGETDLVDTQEVPSGELIRYFIPIIIPAQANNQEDNNLNAHQSILVISSFIAGNWLEKMNIVTKGVEGYRQLKLLKQPIKMSLIVMLLIVTLLIIFCAVWFAFYISRSLTIPIGKLAEATRRVADGELDFVIEKESSDEMGTLVDAFNRMTQDLLASKKELEETNVALLVSNQEVDRRRRYTEIVLQNITAGVISLDKEGRITTINRYAEEFLKLKREDSLQKSYKSILRPRHLTLLEHYLEVLEKSGKNAIQCPVRLTLGDETLSLRVNFVRLADERENQLGIVIVFDDLTELEKAQRMAAWREVARRIAHEVKNPLTPIQLSAQRLRKRYLDKLGPEKEVFDLCTNTIIKQVEELRHLVSEFSNFARMPSVKKSLNCLQEMVREVLILYQEAHKKVTFSIIEQKEIPPFLFDREQMKRVLVNLLDNAVAAMKNIGAIEVILSTDGDAKNSFLEVCDDGPGVPDHEKHHIFEPYFSTKKTGTGLGLTIAKTVVTDHGGYIRIKDRLPHGARFIVELPIIA